MATKKFINWCAAWLPVVAWMSVIFTLSNRSRISVSPEYVLNFLFFKTLHVLEYAFLFVLNVRALRMSNVKGNLLYTYAFIIVLLYAASDEIHQTFVPTREGAVRDVIIDGLGASATWYFLTKQLHKMPKKLIAWVRRLQITS